MIFSQTLDAKSNDKEWIKIKENINNLIKEKFNFKFSFNEQDILII